MDEEINVNAFAKYRLERAKEDLRDSELLYKNNRLLTANNRAYYAIFHAIRAILALERTDFKKHKDVLAYFNQHYIKTEIFPKMMGRRINQAKDIREDSDYDDDYIPTNEETKVQMETARELIKLVEEYLSKNETEKHIKINKI